MFPVHLPKTDFPMKANLAQSEPQRIEFWSSKKIYEKLVARPAPRGAFVMPDGPPYANFSIHVGHVLNKVLKDITVKHRAMAGYKAEFIPGWDCHGLPIELNVTKALGAKRIEVSDKELRRLCREEALKWVAKQKEQFMRLGVLADWEHPYLTLDPAYEADEIRVLARIVENGVFARASKPVYWCPTLQTALAAAEVEYRPHKSPSIFVKFPISEEALTQRGIEVPGDTGAAKVGAVIWTTTPWTLPANQGIAIHPDFDYGFYNTQTHGVLIVAEKLWPQVKEECGLDGALVLSVKGQQLEGLKASHPFIDRTSLFVPGQHVTLDSGSGLVHTAPGHGLDDYVVGLKFNLPVTSPVDGAGRFTSEFPLMQGERIWEANPKIVELLQTKGLLLAHKTIEHSYPHNPRSKTPLIFRATPQWFIRLDDEKFPVREKALSGIKNKISFVPQWGSARLQAMIEHSPDWCVSRQRIWGVPVPVFDCESCGEPLVSPVAMDRLADLMESSGLGLEAYFEKPTDELTKGLSCLQCGHAHFRKGKDILDVWFDSGVCHTAVQKRRLSFPADIYLEGSDQHRGWFQTSLISSVAAYGEIPYKTLITHGFVNDAQGYKMSKSLGNFVDPASIIQESGAEILRLWVSHEDYGQDLTISKEMMTRLSESYRRFRNTFRYLLGNLSDFNPDSDYIEYENLSTLDQWALSQLNDLIAKCQEGYETFQFHKVYHALNQYFTVELSATYLDILKDRLYTSQKDGPLRRGSQTVFFQMLHVLCGLLAPIASFLAEEVYASIPGAKKEESVFLTAFPEPKALWRRPDLQSQFTALMALRSQVTKVLEDLRQKKLIGSSLEAHVTLTLSPHLTKLVEELGVSLREFLIVSKVTLQPQALDQGSEDFKVAADKAPGEKCERCWHFDERTGAQSMFPGLCPKCVEALS